MKIRTNGWLRTGLCTYIGLAFLGAAQVVGAAATIVEEGYRWRNDDNSESAATWKAAADTPITDVKRDENLRLRFVLSLTENGLTSGSEVETRYLEYSEASTNGPWVRVRARGTAEEPAFEVTPTTWYTNGQVTTDLLPGTGSFMIGGRCVAFPAADSIFTVTPATPLGYYNTEFCLQPTAWANRNTTYCFRLGDDPGPALTIEDAEHTTPPDIVLPQGTQNAEKGFSWQCRVRATGAIPMQFGVAGLPDGLALAGNVISGTPTEAGVFPLTITATNSYGTDTEVVQLVVDGGAVPVVNAQAVTNVLGSERLITLSWSDADNPPLTDMSFTIVAMPAHGTLQSYFEKYGVSERPADYYYRPTDAGATSDSFTWRVTDAEDNESGPATVSITITPNTPAVAESGTVDALAGQEEWIEMLLSISDPDPGQNHSICLTAAPAHGSLKYAVGVIRVVVPLNNWIPAGSWSYTADPGYVGTDTFQWKVSDGYSESAAATQTLNVSPDSGTRDDRDLWRWSGGQAWKDPELSDVLAVAVGYSHVAAVAGKEGRVYTSGNNSFGQLGDGTTVGRKYPILAVSGISNIIGVAAGKGNYGFNIAWEPGGNVWAWGNNNSGQLGDGTTSQRLTPVKLGGISDIVAADCGEWHTLAIKADGSVWAWGGNWYGQLGDGTTTNRLTPVQVAGPTGCIAVAAGYGSAGNDASLAVAGDGSLWGWGGNEDGQLGNGTTTGGLTPQRIPGMSSVVRVSTAAGHTLALKADGTVWACGANQYGQLGDGTTVSRLSFVRVPDLSGVVQVVACDSYSLALKLDGSVWGWGSGYSTGSPVRVQMMGDTPLDRVSAIAAGGYNMASLGNGACYGLRPHDVDAPTAFSQSIICGNDRTTKIALSYADRDSRPYEMSISIIATPAQGRLVVAYGPNVYYEPEPGFEGQVSFSWKISDGVSTSATAVCTLAVASTPPGGTNRIVLIVNPNVYASLSNELARLKNDLMWERKDVIILVQAYGTNDLALYTYLKDQYVNHQLQGAILVGAQPEALHAAGIPDPDWANDASYVNMREDIYMANNQLADIWVTRLRAYNLDYPPADGEVGLLRRALDANHYYRTGKLRYPHRAFWGLAANWPYVSLYADYPAMSQIVDGYYATWPQVTYCEAVPALMSGCNFDNQESHGNEVIGGGIYSSAAYNGIFQANIFNGGSCGGDMYKNPMHQQLFTKHGGLVLSVDGNSTYWGDGRRLDLFYPNQDMLLQGASMGDAILADKREGFWSRHYNGDLSVQIMQAPPNAMPVVTSLTASKLLVLPGEPVTFTVSISDVNAADEESPYVDFKHRVEWYMEGWNYGRNDPTCIIDDNQNTNSKTVQITHTFTTPGTRTVRALVMDEWRAVAWKEIAIDEVAPSITATPRCGPAPLPVNFSCGNLDGLTPTYSWAFGDGATSTESNPSHTYATTGIYTATVTVVSGGVAAGSSVQILVASGGAAGPINGSFETPSVGSGYVYNPTGATWTITGAIAGNGSAWSFPAAPDGTQVCCIQRISYASQAFNFDGGTYRIAFFGARRGGGGQTIQVRLDGVSLGSFTATSSAFELFSTTAVTPGAGLHTLTFQGMVNADVTMFIDYVCLIGPAGVDTDGDGIPDSADPDDDNDGMSDEDEAVAGTIPTDPLSVLRISQSAILNPNSEIVIRWQSASNRFYTLQAATNLLDGFTLILGTNIQATPPDNVHTDSVEGVGCRFYRVRVE